MDFEQMTTDLRNHHIQGYLPSGRYVDIPLISHIVDNLYVGGCVQGADVGDYFGAIFSLYQHERYETVEGQALIDIKMYDSTHVDVEALEEVVPVIIAALMGGSRVLINCQAGINRSNLVAAMVLREWKGMTSEQSIALLRAQRDETVLANIDFEEFLLGLDQSE